MCGALRASDAGKKAVLMGWVNRRRDLGNLIFVDVRDRSGVTQVVISEEANTAIHDKAELLRNEFVIAAVGTVKLRDSNTINKNIPTGEVELVAEELRILNEAKHPPFLPSDTALANEEMRLKYRYIDLRRDAMQFNIELRHKVALAIRDYLASGLDIVFSSVSSSLRTARSFLRSWRGAALTGFATSAGSFVRALASSRSPASISLLTL